MAKIIRTAGPEETLEYWVGTEPFCACCSSIIQLESNDEPFVITQEDFTERYYIKCPKCRDWNVKVTG